MRTILSLAAAALALTSVPYGALAQSTPVKIGLVLSYTGANADTGKGVDVAIAAFQKLHGDTVAGRKIEVIHRDDTGMAPEVARRVAQELVVNDHVDFLAGSILTPDAVAVAQVSTQAKVPYFIVNSGASGILKNNPYTARFGFTNVQVTQPLAQWAVRHGIKTAYNLYQDYGPGHEASTIFRQTFTTEGGTVLGEIAMPFSATDFSAYVQRIKEARPNAVFSFINGAGGAEFLKACKTAGFDKAGIRIISAVEMVKTDDLPIAGDAAIGSVSSIDYTPQHDSAANHAFVAAYRAQYGTDRSPDYIAVAAYDIMAAIYKIVAAEKGNLNPDKTMALVREMSFESPRGPIRIQPQTRDIVENIYIREVAKQNGTLVYREIATLPMVEDVTER